MKRFLILALALLLIAASPDAGSSVRTPAASAFQEERVTISSGMMEGFTYELKFTQPNGQVNSIANAQVFQNIWNGAMVDRMSTEQALAKANVWDEIPEGSLFTLKTPDLELTDVEVIFNPNTQYDPRTGECLTAEPLLRPDAVQMLSRADGTVYGCTIPVSFLSADRLRTYDALFGVIRLTFANGNSCDIGIGLKPMAESLQALA